MPSGPTTAASPAGEPGPLAVEIDSALIAPENWQPVDLRLFSDGGKGLDVAARFGLTGIVPGNDNMLPASGAGPAAPLPDALEDIFIPTAVANDDIAAAPRPRRIIRRSSLASAAAAAREDANAAEPVLPDARPHYVMPMPVPQPIDWQAWQASQPRAGGLDRAAVNTLIVIMVAIWTAGVGFGLYKLSTPSYGTQIVWR